MDLIKQKTACFTGHRNQKLPWRSDEDDEHCTEIKRKLGETLQNAVDKGYDTFICGMALGFDMLCAEAVIELKKTNADIKLVAAIPCVNQEGRWSAANQERYRAIMDRCDFVRCVYDSYAGAECMYERNRYMVDNSSLVIAYYLGGGGGTKKTLDYARRHKVEVINLGGEEIPPLLKLNGDD